MKNNLESRDLNSIDYVEQIIDMIEWRENSRLLSVIYEY